MTAATPLTPPPEAPSPLSPLSAEDAAERAILREQLRDRHSVDHIARGWYGGIGALILTGLCARAPIGGVRFVLFAVAAGLAWVFSTVYAVRAVRLVRVEGEKLRRMQELDARAPKPPELF